MKLARSAPEHEAWLRRLRERFVAVARRRLTEEAVEDVVQDALSIIHEKSSRASPPDPAWCFQVLRNTIGNHYQKSRVRARGLDPDAALLPEASPTPLESLEEKEVTRLVRESVDELATNDSQCGRYLQRILEGESPADIAVAESVEPKVLYRRIYRCRGKLRGILLEKGALS